MRYQSFKFSQKKININPNSIDTAFFQAYKLYQKNLTSISQYYQKLTEWVVWTFPELQRFKLKIKDFVILNSIICGDSTLIQPNFELIKSRISDEYFIQEALNLAQISIGSKVSPQERQQIQQLSHQILKLFEQKEKLNSYLQNRVTLMAPNMVSLIGSPLTIKFLIKCKGLEKLAIKSASQIEMLQSTGDIENQNKNQFLLIQSEIFKNSNFKENKILRNLSQKLSLFAKIDYFSGGCNVISSDELMKVKLSLLGADGGLVNGVNTVNGGINKINEIYGDKQGDNSENQGENQGIGVNNESEVKNNENGTRQAFQDEQYNNYNKNDNNYNKNNSIDNDIGSVQWFDDEQSENNKNEDQKEQNNQISNINSNKQENDIQNEQQKEHRHHKHHKRSHHKNDEKE